MTVAACIILVGNKWHTQDPMSKKRKRSNIRGIRRTIEDDAIDALSQLTNSTTTFCDSNSKIVEVFAHELEMKQHDLMEEVNQLPKVLVDDILREYFSIKKRQKGDDDKESLLKNVIVDTKERNILLKAI